MLNGKFVSTKSIIEQVYQDTGITDEISWEDMIAWCFKGLELIGAPSQYVKKIAGPINYDKATFDNYKVELPCDFHALRGVAVDGCIANYAHNIVHHLLDGSCYIKDGKAVPNTGAIVGEGYYNDNFGNTFLAGSPPSYNANLEFDISSNVITFNVKSGEAVIFYNAVPIDEEGFPQIPEDISYQEALMWYITNKIDYLRWRTDPNSHGLKALYDLSSQKCAWYKAQASTKARMPDIGMMENIKKMVISMQPRVNIYNEWMANIGRHTNRSRT